VSNIIFCKVLVFANGSYSELGCGCIQSSEMFIQLYFENT